MTDQEKLSGQLTQVDASSKLASKIEPRILELTDLEGRYIESHSVVKISDFFIKGVANVASPAQILDGGTEIATAHVDETGHFETELFHQSLGTHIYTVLDEFGQESSPWVVTIAAVDQLLIESVIGPNDETIENGSSTVHNDLRFTGRGAPGKVVDLLDNGIVLRLLNVAGNGHWSAHLTGLKPGNHKFVARELNGKESAPWLIEIEKPASLSIQFGYGQGNHQPINDGETTTQTEIVLVGTAKPYEFGRILSDAHEMVIYDANEFGIFVAPITGLIPGYSYRFVCRSESEPNRQSEPWTIKVASSKLPQR
ncbi:hypothetical protein [Pseudomonas sp. IT-347P]|uniref:hypothetical protein n=1 Tax=Pseudomonas sp. IT-347P TaxID=3026458 RepID=UPI0039E0E427